MPTLRHATLSRRMAGILRDGLLAGKSRGRRRCVWLHTPGRSEWAVLHVICRHGGRPEQVTLIDVSVPRRWLRRGPRPGLWYVLADIPPERFRGHGLATEWLAIV
ncbi:MAG TPA: hypothetical protein VNK04_01190 [Gemmataceae bacterium]|nr:hypothetical protein [Gemmataceae bacterium]